MLLSAEDAAAAAAAATAAFSRQEVARHPILLKGSSRSHVMLKKCLNTSFQAIIRVSWLLVNCPHM